MASFSVSGLVPMSAAIAGSEVAITVESMFSMNRAVATMSGMRRCLSMGDAGRGGETGLDGVYHPTVMEAIAEGRGIPKSGVTCARLAWRLGPREPGARVGSRSQKAVHGSQRL